MNWITHVEYVLPFTDGFQGSIQGNYLSKNDESSTYEMVITMKDHIDYDPNNNTEEKWCDVDDLYSDVVVAHIPTITAETAEEEHRLQCCSRKNLARPCCWLGGHPCYVSFVFRVFKGAIFVGLWLPSSGPWTVGSSLVLSIALTKTR